VLEYPAGGIPKRNGSEGDECISAQRWASILNIPTLSLPHAASHDLAPCPTTNSVRCIALGVLEILRRARNGAQERRHNPRLRRCSVSYPNPISNALPRVYTLLTVQSVHRSNRSVRSVLEGYSNRRLEYGIRTETESTPAVTRFVLFHAHR
jgi:hypothetical protein